jgi:hypothetical protein
MSNAKAVDLKNEKYVPYIEDGEIVSIKKYNAKYGMWVILKFTGSNKEAESELLELLKKESIRQMSQGNS